MGLELAAHKRVQVNESDEDVPTGIRVRRGDTLIFHAAGQIWAGVWFTGNNGPRGWNNLDNDPKFKLPGSHPYCLLGKLDTGYFYVGDHMRIDGADDQGELFLRINDDVPGNGSGAFSCDIQVYRNGA
jgi:hypothetical protein